MQEAVVYVKGMKYFIGLAVKNSSTMIVGGDSIKFGIERNQIRILRPST